MRIENSVADFTQGLYPGEILKFKKQLLDGVCENCPVYAGLETCVKCPINKVIALLTTTLLMGEDVATEKMTKALPGLKE